MFEFRHTNPLRVPDWKWQTAQYVATTGAKISRIPGGKMVHRAVKFIKQMNHVDNDVARFELQLSDPEISEAMELYKTSGQSQMARWEMEARLLAGQTYDEISRKTGYNTDQIRVYEDLFFDIRDRLTCPMVINTVVIKASLQRGISEREPDSLWKMFAYWCGPIFLDMLIYRFNQPMRVSSASELAAALADDFREQLQLKAMIAIRAMPLNWQTQTEVINLYLRLVELERNAGDGADGQESMKQGIQSLLENLPWTKDAGKARQANLIDDLERDGVGLRAHELLLTANGDVPPGLRETVASAVYPARLQQTTVSN